MTIDEIFSNMGDLVTLTADAVSSLSQFFKWLPTPVIAVIFVALGVVVLYKVLGREG